jgi:hypothetical protein
VPARLLQPVCDGRPLRASFAVENRLLPQGAANLHVAGRCAGMTHEGQSAARASGACFVMGQAAGTAAALRVQGRFTLERLQQRLQEDGALLRP